LITAIKNETIMRLLVEDTKYSLWIPKDEAKEFHPIIKEHSKEIFGKDTLYFDGSLTLKSVSGLGAKPDGFVLDLARNKWYIVEAELSTHSPYDHIVNQLTRFVNAIDSLVTRTHIVDALHDEIDRDKMLRAYVEGKITGDIHRWLSRLISQTPKIVVVIEKKTDEVSEACRFLTRSFETHILELKTFVSENDKTIHAHLFEPLHIEGRIEPAETERKSHELKLSDTEEAVLEFVRGLDHPANTTEVRDKFGFPLRANARRIFRKLHAMGYGEDRKVGRRHLFYVTNKVYPEPKAE